MDHTVDPIDESCGQDDFSASGPHSRQGVDKEATLKTDYRIPVEKLRWTCVRTPSGGKHGGCRRHVETRSRPGSARESALKFGMKMGGNDYNIYVVGRASNRPDLPDPFLSGGRRPNDPTPSDWCLRL
jgi:hypothetical protein